MREINLAWQVLGDEAGRAAYDRSLGLRDDEGPVVERTHHQAAIDRVPSVLPRRRGRRRRVALRARRGRPRDGAAPRPAHRTAGAAGARPGAAGAEPARPAPGPLMVLGCDVPGRLGACCSSAPRCVAMFRSQSAEERGQPTALGSPPDGHLPRRDPGRAPLRVRQDARSTDELVERTVGLPPATGVPLRRWHRATELRVIAEIKRRSPSKGPLAVDLDPATLAAAYAAGRRVRACRCSPTSDHFGGSAEDLGRGPGGGRRSRCCARTSPSAPTTCATPA